MLRNLLPVVSAAVLPMASLACETPVAWTNDQVRERVTVLQSAEAQDFEKVFAYEELACAERGSVRALALSEALKSGSEALRSSLLFEAVFSRQNLILEPYDTGALTEAQRALAAETPAVQFKFAHHDRATGCISTNRPGRCDGGYNVDVRPNGISIAHAGASAELNLDEDGVLRGNYVPAGSAVSLPVSATIF